jgi:hypothetical protein
MALREAALVTSVHVYKENQHDDETEACIQHAYQNPEAICSQYKIISRSVMII